MSLLIKNVKIAGRGPGVAERGDVLVTGKVISAIGSLKGKRAARTIDGQGTWLTPGFIDAESTADRYLSLFEPHYGAAIVAEGVTTVIGGHCGLTLPDLQEKGLDLPHALRARTLPFHFETLAGAASGGVHSVHLEDISEKSIKEALKAIKSGAWGGKIFFPHLLPPEARARDAARITAFLAQAAKFAEVRAGVSPSAHRLRKISVFLPERMRDMSADDLRKAFRDPWTHERLLRELPEVHPDLITILEAKGNALLRNTPLTEFMLHHGIVEPREGLLALMRSSGLQATLLLSGAYPRLAIQLLESEHVLLGTHVPYPVGTDHPFSAALRGLLRRGWSFEAAIEKLTAAPALFFDVRKRGVVREGYFADLVLFTHNKEVGTVIANGVVRSTLQ